MRRKFSVTPITYRAGITWIEVVVSVLILLVLAALFLPSANYGRDKARLIECQDNMKQLVTATLNWSARSHGQLPDLYEDFTSKSGQTARVPWTMSLLADLDNRNVRRAFEASPREIAESPISIKSMVCPVDTNNFGVAGGLSYVVNTGFIREDIYARSATQWPFAHSLDSIDWNRDGEITDADRRIARSTGCLLAASADD